MTPEQFVYWLQGFLEVQDPKTLDERQTQILKDHMALVLTKETPARPAFPSGKLCAPDLSKDLKELVDKVLKEGKPKDNRTLKEKLGFRPNLRLSSPDTSNQTYC